MARVKSGKTTKARRKRLFAQTKGYRHGRKNLVRQARQAVLKAAVFSYRDRRVKKRDFRRLWITRINAALKPFGIRYSQFIADLKNNGIELNRKMLSEIALQKPEQFADLVKRLKK
ncbi:MAG TPA: 50S ribosomal protein L20 [bacterium]|nr:50S ribosomal protein L20 [bacterium]HOR57718.1 50S ribosomal protein L20 [bacterium]HPL56361.1 50S ribosomal protein L20 [bacterium]